MGHAYKEKRVHKRKSIAVPLFYTYSGLDADKPKKFFAGKTFDISDSGMGFYTNKLLLDGAGINIICKDLWDEQRAGTVRWHKTLILYSHLYLVGVDLQ